MREIVTIHDREDESLLDAFYAGPYLEAFHHQAEPLEVWKRRLWGSAEERAPYELTIRIARDGGDIHGGIVFERYPRSACGLMTYMVVAGSQRRHGLGKQLIDEAIRALHARLVFGEASVPHDDESWQRIELFQRWGARAVGAPYVQPRLGPDLQRDRALRLFVFPGSRPTGAPLGATAPGPTIAAFLDEFYTVTEGTAPDDELRAVLAAYAGDVPLLALDRDVDEGRR